MLGLGRQFGCVSARLFYLELRRILDAAPGGRHTKPPGSLQGQLIWREFFYTCSAFTPNFGQMVRCGRPLGPHPRARMDAGPRACLRAGQRSPRVLPSRI